MYLHITAAIIIIIIIIIIVIAITFMCGIYNYIPDTMLLDYTVLQLSCICSVCYVMVFPMLNDVLYYYYYYYYFA